MSDWSKHRMTVTIGDGGWVGFHVTCGHDPADTTRPCWPYDTEREPPVPLPAPQPCNLTDWIDALDPDDWLTGDFDVECGVSVEWTGDGAPMVTLREAEEPPACDLCGGTGIYVNDRVSAVPSRCPRGCGEG